MSKPWTTKEEANVRAVHASGMPYAQMMHLWPDRTPQAVSCHASEMGLGQRPVPLRRDFSHLLPLVLAELEKKPARAYDVADRVGACREWIGRLLRSNLESDDPKVQVVRWTRSGNVGPWSEVWALGAGEIVAKPVPLSRVQRKQLTRMAENAAQASPFAVAAGLATVPVDRRGRVVRNLLDDDRAAA
ncbi:hypothetical protein LFL96_21065 [Paraburkholderia sp. D15]|uniref:hypothetical protein n=1 Tax=Paraburkholderia sp. D15 TaxID=2880218 RepID=UPI0024785AB4|nr:hypothetical protein [Paraburkholderia sp. D15]WGS53552.1 hypothetical protein LFL96_21065 [Paraburkholderia sp. D15]